MPSPKLVAGVLAGAVVASGAAWKAVATKSPNSPVKAERKSIERFLGISPFTTEAELGWSECSGGRGPQPPGGPVTVRTCRKTDKEKDETYEVAFAVDQRFPKHMGRLLSIKVELRHLMFAPTAREKGYFAEFAKKYGPFSYDDGPGAAADVRACQPGAKCIEDASVYILPGTNAADFYAARGRSSAHGPTVMFVDDALEAEMQKAIEDAERVEGQRAAQSQ